MKKFLFASFFCCSLSAFAAPQEYQIELIAFSNLSSTGLDSEQWPMISPSKNVNNLGNPVLESRNKFKLEPVLHNLEKDPHYKVLLHVAWRETLAQLDRTHSIHLYGGQAFDSAGRKLAGFVTDQSIPYDQAAAWQVNGLMSVSLNHYFDLNLNLYFAEPIDELKDISKNGYFSHADNGLFYFHSQENRRSKSGELNYFDYPVAGVLVEIFPS